jgi:hypothetical protein
VLKFKGALGYLGYRPEPENQDRDSGNSSSSQTSDDEESDLKQFYTSTGVLIPQSQAVSEIKVTRFSMKEITSFIEAYRKTAKKHLKFSKMFDTKQIVTKQETISKLESKVPIKEVRSLALDALKFLRETS